MKLYFTYHSPYTQDVILLNDSTFWTMSLYMNRAIPNKVTFNPSKPSEPFGPNCIYDGPRRHLSGLWACLLCVVVSVGLEPYCDHNW